MKEKKPEIKIDYFHVDGWKHSITFTPDENKVHYQIMNEHSTKIIKKGELCNIKT
jgi:hypothetical protein|tara:strand:- start:1491 stop:1655 length:165 start_codon:yes stop_codon:yes gene_type:complete